MSADDARTDRYAPIQTRSQEQASGNSVDNAAETVFTIPMTKRCICGARIEGRIFKSRAGSEVRDVCVDSWKKADAEHREETESERELRQGARALRRQWM